MDIEKRCKTCQHWTRYTSGIGYNRIESCDMRFGKCDSKKWMYPFNYEEDKKVEPDGVVYKDAEQYMAYFATGEDFGCIHWAEKMKK